LFLLLLLLSSHFVGVCVGLFFLHFLLFFLFKTRSTQPMVIVVVQYLAGVFFWEGGEGTVDF